MLRKLPLDESGAIEFGLIAVPVANILALTSVGGPLKKRLHYGRYEA